LQFQKSTFGFSSSLPGETLVLTGEWNLSRLG